MKRSIHLALQANFILILIRICVNAQPVVITNIPDNSIIFRSTGDFAYFSAGDALWRTDGTKGGTILLRSGFNQIQYPGTEFRGDFYFLNSIASELWRSNGTREGTILLKRFSGNNIQFLGSTDQYLFFSASDGPTGRELYRTNGTLTGTVLLKDLLPGIDSGFRGHGTVIGSTFFFAGDDGIHGTELWKSDGTQAGTTMVKDVNTGEGDGFVTDPFVIPTAAGDLLYFFAYTTEFGNEPWVSDGTDEGTFLLKDIVPGEDSSGSLIYLIADKNFLYFLTLDDFYSGPVALWKTAGTPASTVMVKIIYHDSGLLEFPTSFIYHDKAYFLTDRSDGGFEELWVTNGTARGTTLLLGITIEGNVSFFVDVNDYLLYTGSVQNSPLDFYRTDGTLAGTKAFARFKASAYGVFPRSFRKIGDLVFYADHDGPTDIGFSGDPFSQEDYYHLFQTDGVTTQSMRTLWGINTIGTANIIGLQGKVIFTTQNDQPGSPDNGKKLWIYDPAKRPPPTARFMLVNSQDDQDQRRLFDGTSIAPNGLFNIRYEPIRNPASVVFTVNGRVTRVENRAPYSLAGDVSGNYAKWAGASPGIYTLTATAYSQANGQGTVLESRTISFRIECPDFQIDCIVTGGVLRELWTDVPGTTVSVIPRNRPPDISSFLRNFEGPSNSGTNYGARITGYVIPPATGEYTFWIASDNYSQLWLSSDDKAENKRRIAFVSGFTMPRQWEKFSSQRSSPVLLTQGTKYYIEALHKEGVGPDHVAVGWQLPDGTLERPIPANRLSPFDMNNATMAFTADEAAVADENVTQINIYPNPARNVDHQLTVSGFDEIKAPTETEVEIINMTGDIVFAAVFSCGGDCNSYSMKMDEHLVSGVYLVNITTNGIRHSKRLLVK